VQWNPKRGRKDLISFRPYPAGKTRGGLKLVGGRGFGWGGWNFSRKRGRSNNTGRRKERGSGAKKEVRRSPQLPAGPREGATRG